MENTIKTDKYRIKPGEKVKLGDIETDYRGDLTREEVEGKLMPEVLEELKDLQERLFAQCRYGLTVVFQAMDAAGKDGTVKHVFSDMDPNSVHVVSFKSPTSLELEHDYLWRINAALPKRGEIGIFNRSHYEEVVITRIHDLLKFEKLPEHLADEDVWKRRYRQINDWERYLTENGFPMVKIFLHVSKREQQKRLFDRIFKENKNWKFAISDLTERKYWDEYQELYSDVIENTATDDSPWYVVPADSKWYTRYAVACIVRDALLKVNPQFPVVSETMQKQIAEFKEQLQQSDIEDLKRAAEKKGFIDMRGVIIDQPKQTDEEDKDKKGKKEKDKKNK